MQEVVSRVCNAWTLWHHGLWVMHHVYGHHSFTGPLLSIVMAVCHDAFAATYRTSCVCDFQRLTD